MGWNPYAKTLHITHKLKYISVEDLPKNAYVYRVTNRFDLKSLMNKAKSQRLNGTFSIEKNPIGYQICLYTHGSSGLPYIFTYVRS